MNSKSDESFYVADVDISVTLLKSIFRILDHYVGQLQKFQLHNRLPEQTQDLCLYHIVSISFFCMSPNQLNPIFSTFSTCAFSLWIA
jgi:hypothetical protein